MYFGLPVLPAGEAVDVTEAFRQKATGHVTSQLSLHVTREACTRRILRDSRQAGL